MPTIKQRLAKLENKDRHSDIQPEAEYIALMVAVTGCTVEDAKADYAEYAKSWDGVSINFEDIVESV